MFLQWSFVQFVLIHYHFDRLFVPAGIELKVKVSEDTRLTAWLSVDGRNRHELQQQDRLILFN